METEREWPRVVLQAVRSGQLTLAEGARRARRIALEKRRKRTFLLCTNRTFSLCTDRKRNEADQSCPTSV
jgi:hypothetical protein